MASSSSVVVQTKMFIHQMKRRLLALYISGSNICFVFIGSNTPPILLLKFPIKIFNKRNFYWYKKRNFSRNLLGSPLSTLAEDWWNFWMEFHLSLIHKQYKQKHAFEYFSSVNIFGSIYKGVPFNPFCDWTFKLIDKKSNILNNPKSDIFGCK